MSAAAPAPGGRRGLADSPLFAFFHALSFCVELFKREIRGSFMLMYRTKAAARGRRPRRCPEAGVAVRGGRRPAARVSRVPQGLTKQPLIPANTKPLLGLGLRTVCTRERAPPRRDGGRAWLRSGLDTWAKRAWGRTSVNPARVRSRGRVVGGRDADNSVSPLPGETRRVPGVRLRTLLSSSPRISGAAWPRRLPHGAIPRPKFSVLALIYKLHAF